MSCSAATPTVAIANSRLVSLTDGRIGFRWKDYRHHGKSKVMTLDAFEFIRRFLLHTLPDGFHRIRHYGFLANGHRDEKLALCRKLLAIAPAVETSTPLPQHGKSAGITHDPCPYCGGTMIALGTPSPSPPSRLSFWMTAHEPPAIVHPRTRGTSTNRHWQGILCPANRRQTHTMPCRWQRHAIFRPR